MSRTQSNPVGNEIKSSVVQQNLEELFQFAHDHPVRSSFPADRDGSAGDMVIVDDGSSIYACFKTSRGWFKTSALTAV